MSQRRRAARLNSWPSVARVTRCLLLAWIGAMHGGCLLPRPSRTVLLPRADLGAVPRTLQRRSSLTLEVLQEEARRRNPVASQWAARVVAAEERTRQVRAGYFPVLQSEARYLRIDEEVSFSDPLTNTDIIVQDEDAFTIVNSLRYRLLDWGRVHHAHRASQEDAKRELASQKRVLQSLEFQVARVFYGILSAREELETVETSVKTLEGSLQLANSLESVGRVTRADVLVVEANLERRRLLAREIQDLVEARQEELAVLLDLPPETPISLQPPSETDVPDANAQRYEALALQRREDLRALDAAHQALLEARRSEVATYLPDVGVFLQHEHSTTDSDFRDPDSFSGGVNASWELFDGFRRGARVRELDAEAFRVQGQSRELARRIQLEVRQAVRALVRAADRVGVAATVISQAEENLRRQNALFRQGRASGQELLEAESLLTSERARAVQARFDVALRLEELRFACGVESAAELADTGANVGDVPEGDGPEVENR